jgi:hypothetical protein
MKKNILILIFSIGIISCKDSQIDSSESRMNQIEVRVPKPLTEVQIKELVFEKYASMNKEEGDFKSPPKFVKQTFERLLLDVKNTQHEKRVVFTIDSLGKVISKSDLKEKLIRKKELVSSRKEYEQKLRNSFLDNNLNIKVKVSGKDNTSIKMTYALFDEIWFRKFETEGFFTKLNNLGFTKITLSDGYDYGEYVQYK